MLKPLDLSMTEKLSMVSAKAGMAHVTDANKAVQKRERTVFFTNCSGADGIGY